MIGRGLWCWSWRPWPWRARRTDARRSRLARRPPARPPRSPRAAPPRARACVRHGLSLAHSRKGHTHLTIVFFPAARREKDAPSGMRSKKAGKIQFWCQKKKSLERMRVGVGRDVERVLGESAGDLRPNHSIDLHFVLWNSGTFPARFGLGGEFQLLRTGHVAFQHTLSIVLAQTPVSTTLKRQREF